MGRRRPAQANRKDGRRHSSAGGHARAAALTARILASRSVFGSVLGGSCAARQRKGERRLLGGGGDLDFAAVGLGNLGDDVEAESESILPSTVAAKVGLEEVRELVVRDRRAFVGDLDRQGSLISLDDDGDRRPRGA